MGLSLLLNELLGTHAISGLGVNVRIGDGPVYPVANVAAITALAFGIAPFIVRPLRRIFVIVILLVCAAAMYLGAGFPADVLGGLLVGFGGRRAGPGGARRARRPAVGRRGARRAHRPRLRRRDHRARDRDTSSAPR